MRWIALTCLAALLVGCDSSAQSRSPSDDPSSSSSAASSAAVESPQGDVVNGRIVSADPAPRPPRSWCPDCDYSRPQDRVGDTALYLRRAGTNRSGATWIDGVSVVGPRGVALEASCPRDFPCFEGGSAPRAEDLAQVDWQFTGWGPVALGPGAGELSMSSVARRVDIVPFEGGRRRSVTLRGLGARDLVQELAWSPDRSHLAVVARSVPSTANNPAGLHVWVFDADGRHGEIRYTAHTNSIAHLDDLVWSPKGDALSVLESDEFGVNAPYLVVVGAESGKARKVFWWASGDDSPTYVWSPDGRRIAVEAGRRLLELSVDDGRVLARHPGVPDPVWLQESP